jgi:hypothetical protein
MKICPKLCSKKLSENFSAEKKIHEMGTRCEARKFEWKKLAIAVRTFPQLPEKSETL